MRLPTCISVFLLSLVSILFVSFSPSQTHADTYTDVTQEQQQQVQIQTLTVGILNALVCQLVGVNPVNPHMGCVTIDPRGGLTTKAPVNEDGTLQAGGLLGMSSAMIGSMYNVPIHTEQFTSHLANNFGIAKSAQAQEAGQGFRSLGPLLEIWQQIRNLAYLLFVGIFILIGFGIMLRIKIDPRTVMTLQNQIPKVIIGIILITFSYAIAGFLVDGMWVVTYAGTNILTDEVDLCSAQEAKKPLNSVATNNLNNPIAYMSDMLGDETGCFGSWDGIGGMATSLGFTVGDIVSRIGLEIMGFNSENLTSKDCIDTDGTFLWVIPKPDINPGGCIQYAIFNVFKYLIGIAAIFAIGVAIIIALFRVWFSLLRSYVRILLYVIFSPLWIMAGLLPNNSLGFSSWIRTFIANLAVFPATIFLFILASRFASNDQINNPSTSGSFIPPLIGNTNMADNMGLIVAFGLILITPELINTLRDALKSPPSKYGAAIQKGITSGTSTVGGAASPLWSSLWQHGGPGKPTGVLRTYALENKYYQGAAGLIKSGLRKTAVGRGLVRARELSRDKAFSPYGHGIGGTGTGSGSGSGGTGGTGSGGSGGGTS